MAKESGNDKWAPWVVSFYPPPPSTKGWQGRGETLNDAVEALRVHLRNTAAETKAEVDSIEWAMDWADDGR